MSRDTVENKIENPSSTRGPRLKSPSIRAKEAQMQESKIEKRISRWSDNAKKFQYIGSPLKDIKFYALELSGGTFLISKDENGNHSMVDLNSNLVVKKRRELSDDGKTEIFHCGILTK